VLLQAEQPEGCGIWSHNGDEFRAGLKVPGVVEEFATGGLLLKTWLWELHGNTTLQGPCCCSAATTAGWSVEVGGDTSRQEPVGKCLAEGAALAMSATEDSDVDGDAFARLSASGPLQMLLMLWSGSALISGTMLAGGVCASSTVRVKPSCFSGLLGPITNTQLTALAPATSTSLLEVHQTS